jgi:hypothetical protein
MNELKERRVAGIIRQVLTEAFFVSRFDGSFDRAICPEISFS